MRQHPSWGRSFVGATLAFIAVITLTPTGSPGGAGYAFCVTCSTVAARDIFLNVVLFMPFGMALRVAGTSFRRAAVGILATTCTIEILQLFFVAGRYASLTDVATNAIGGMLGWALAPLAAALLAPSPALARKSQLVLAAMWIVLTTVGLLSLRPTLPDTQYYGQWQRRWPNMSVFQGRLLAASLNGMEIPNDAIVRDRMAEALRRGAPMHVEATVVAGATTDGLAPIVTISAEHLGVVVLLAQNSRALVMRARTWAAAAHFTNPAWTVDSVLPQEAGDTLRLSFTEDGRTAHAEWWNLTRGTHDVRDITVNPLHGPLFLVPLEWPITGHADWELLLIVAVCGAALGWLGGCAAREHWALPVAVILATGALVFVMIPVATGDARAPGLAWGYFLVPAIITFTLGLRRKIWLRATDAQSLR